jgi:hypothetical protein
MRNIYKFIAVAFFVFVAGGVFGQARIGISGTVEWDRMEINAAVSLDLASAGLKIPAGRTQGEALIASEYIRLIRAGLLSLQIDSSSTFADLIERGEWTLSQMEDLVLQARSVPPALSHDFGSLSSAYTLGIGQISSALIRHTRPAQAPRTLNPVPAPAYTGIVIIASENLPVHGLRGTALVQPCIFPKIWDSDMNLIFERNMLDPETDAAPHYFQTRDIFNNTPSGLSPEITAIVGNRPLRIIARGTFGITPTDLILGREDIMPVISTDGNRQLLREGKIAIILNEAVLRRVIEER